MKTQTEVKDKKKIPEGLLAQQNAGGEQNLPDEEDSPTSDNSLSALPTREHAKSGEPADGYQERTEDTTRDDLWQSAEEFPGAPTTDEAQTEELSGAPQDVGLDEKSSADDYVGDSADQTSRGGLTEEYFSRSAEVNEEVPTDQIRHFEGIPDYLTETISPVPIVARIGDEFFCIEGWKMVEDARRRKHE